MPISCLASLILNARGSKFGVFELESVLVKALNRVVVLGTTLEVVQLKHFGGSARCSSRTAITARLTQGMGVQSGAQGASQFVGASSRGRVQTSVGSRGGNQQRRRGGPSKATGRVYNMSQQEVQASLEVIIGVRLSALRNELAISVPTGDVFMVGTMYRDNMVLVGDIFLEVDLIPLDMVDLDVIMGMDWLAKHCASVDCFRKEVIFRSREQPEVTFYGYLAHVIDTWGNGLRLEHIPGVREFSDVFPEDLPGLPPHREIEFTSELILRTNLISQAPYIMAPAELRKLKIIIGADG
ncbi:hypothetical protein L3X38_004442 [Prunus dulcis]|uniref:Transposable element protein n=1 Tax=Prunus dulcis TaxID=3755 RepID=A0AAD4ZP09_PRUDU|nr:hypothetical protein L3X38_004442 [Prunus dulcis]